MKITSEKKDRPIKIIQFGGGVFLRGFIDWLVQRANDLGVMDAGIVIVRSKTRGEDPLSHQNYNYTHLARDGEHNDITLIDSIMGSVSASEEYSKFLSLAENSDTEVIVSNTTEAGIVYEACPSPESKCPDSFPAKLCALLYRRYRCALSPMLIVPCELIEQNATKLKQIVIQHAQDWGLGDGFLDFIEKCSFRNTLVDRIVSGKPSDKLDLGYEDKCVNASEYFHLFVIEGERDERLPLDEVSSGVKYVESVDPYRTIKVRILNGAHTSMIPYALILGVQSVGECLKNDTLRAHLTRCLDEIITSLETDKDEAREYADDVLKRFANPYIYHRCDAIVLNSISKFKVRVLPSIIAYKEKTGSYPKALIFSLAMLIKLYKSGLARDDEAIIKKIKRASLDEILSDIELWGQDLSPLKSEVEKHDN